MSNRSKTFTHNLAPGHKMEEYVISETIEAIKPEA